MGTARAVCTAGLVVGALGLVPAAGAAQSAPVGRVPVVLQNYDAAPRDVARLAQLEVTRLFALVGVEVSWVPEPAGDTRAARVLKMTTWEPPAGRIPATALGFTNEGPHGTRRSYVIWPRVQKTALRSAVGLDAMLAVAMAHELGHLLLPVKSHESHGLMRASWDENDLRLAAAGLLHFSKESAVKIALGLRPETAIADKESERR
jgi:hypothetical protein